jgi:cell pole-organizing protein PopZ
MLTPKPAPAVPSTPAPPAAATTVSNRSLDSIVEDAARGMIQEWIGKNMERIVREEAAKAAAKVPPKT